VIEGKLRMEEEESLKLLDRRVWRISGIHMMWGRGVTASEKKHRVRQLSQFLKRKKRSEISTLPLSTTGERLNRATKEKRLVVPSVKEKKYTIRGGRERGGRR